MIGIIGAMDEEISQIKAKLSDVTVTEIAAMTFNKGKLGSHDIVAVRSGIGKVNAAVCTQILATYFHVDHIINTGMRLISGMSLSRRMHCSMIWMPRDSAMNRE